MSVAKSLNPRATLTSGAECATLTWIADDKPANADW
jgi:hypothetical protein